MTLKQDFVKRIRRILKEMNEENYSDLDIGLSGRVEYLERKLYKIEFQLFGNVKIQEGAFRRHKRMKK